MSNTRVVILGRDGILNDYREDHVKAPEEWQPIAGALDAVARLNHGGWHAVVATNQSGIGRGMIDMASVNAVHAHMNQQLVAEGGRLDAVFFCPHTPEDACTCRKPLPGMMLEVAKRYNVELHAVPMVCDTVRDLLAAQAAGCEPHLVLSGRAAGLEEEPLRQIVQQVPGTTVHADLAAFADHLLDRDHIAHSALGRLS
jgi:D-glycero-D-manno-heptose 1,7-bisphosphate phosphatase